MIDSIDQVLEVRKTMEFRAAPERVWRAISEPEELARWFPDSVEGEVRPGGDGAWVWENHGRYAVRFEIVEPPTRLVWRWARDPDVPLAESHSTRVEWILDPRADGGTTLKLREWGFASPEDQSTNDDGWTAELGELAALLDSA